MLAKVEFTTRCNLDCIHCCASIYRPAPDWKTDQLLRVFRHLVHEGYTTFELKGGEPFMRSDIFEVLDLLEQCNTQFYLTSNSLLLTEEKIKKLFSYKGLSTFAISLDGARKETHEAMRGKNTFEYTLEMIELVSMWRTRLNSQTRVGLDYTMTKINYREIGEIFNIADRFGFDSVIVLSLSVLGNAVEHKNELFLPEREELLTLQRGAAVLRKINVIRQIKGLNPIEIDMELFPYTWKCKLMKWLRNFRNYGGEHACGSGTREVYVGADGTIFPCEGVRILQDVIEKEVGPYERPNIQEYTIQEAKKTESFRRIVEFLHDDRIFSSLVPCNMCEQLRKCTVCPLYAMAEGGMKRCTKEVLS